jgi:hypothetical protein
MANVLIDFPEQLLKQVNEESFKASIDYLSETEKKKFRLTLEQLSEANRLCRVKGPDPGKKYVAALKAEWEAAHIKKVQPSRVKTIIKLVEEAIEYRNRKEV